MPVDALSVLECRQHRQRMKSVFLPHAMAASRRHPLYSRNGRPRVHSGERQRAGRAAEEGCAWRRRLRIMTDAQRYVLHSKMR
jgi:hypothetical protein